MQSRRAGQSGSKGRSTCPTQVLSQLLLAFLDGGDLDLGRLPDDANSAGRLIRLILHGMPATEALCMASAGAIGLCQVEQTLYWSRRSHKICCSATNPLVFAHESAEDCLSVFALVTACCLSNLREPI